MKRRPFLHTIAALPGALALADGAAAAGDAAKVLRVAFEAAETGFDPVQISDAYSIRVASHIFESLFRYDHLARPVKIRPCLADAMPESSDDFRVWTVRISPGIFFADDPAFGGRPRELVAAGVLYSLKRYADPALKSPNWNELEQLGIRGLAAMRAQALADARPFDAGRDIDGLRALDPRTLQLRLDAPRPRLIENLASNFYPVLAREVVDAYGDRVGEHPVGTGPFRLGAWRRSSRIVLERNPRYREVRYDADPAADDIEGQALLARFKGRRLPMVDRVEISIIEEAQPRWLTFLEGGLDLVQVPPEYTSQAMPGVALAPYLAKRGVTAYREMVPTVSYTYFNMEHPVVGGYTAERVALRRAIALAMNVEREIALLRGGLDVVAHSPIAAQSSGFDPTFRSENGEYSPARAKALLDLFGYVDRDGDGWREQPDGSPLLLEVATAPSLSSRRFDDLFQRDMKAIGVLVRFATAQWPEQLKAAHAGKLMIWSLGYGVTRPDGQESLARYYDVGGFNLARFKRPEMDAIFERLLALPDGPERLALFDRAKRIAVAYMPYKTRYHRVVLYLAQPSLIGFRLPVFWSNWYHMVDIDRSKLPS